MLSCSTNNKQKKKTIQLVQDMLQNGSLTSTDKQPPFRYHTRLEFNQIMGYYDTSVQLEECAIFTVGPERSSMAAGQQQFFQADYVPIDLIHLSMFLTNGDSKQLIT